MKPHIILAQDLADLAGYHRTNNNGALAIDYYEAAARLTRVIGKKNYYQSCADEIKVLMNT